MSHTVSIKFEHEGHEPVEFAVGLRGDHDLHDVLKTAISAIIRSHKRHFGYARNFQVIDALSDTEIRDLANQLKEPA